MKLRTPKIMGMMKDLMRRTFKFSKKRTRLKMSSKYLWQNALVSCSKHTRSTAENS
jgi:hypothetical protein